MVSWAILGASRGLGLEFVLQLAARPNTTVFALVRNTSTSTHFTEVTKGLKNVHAIEGDIADYGSLEAAAQTVSEISGGTLDCLVINAARIDHVNAHFEDFASMEALDEEFIASFKVNTLGVVHSITVFLPLLRASTASIKKIVSVSTGSADAKITRIVEMDDLVAYSTTKSSGVMVATKWALKLKDEGFVVISLNPGIVDTSATGDDAAKKVFSQISESGGLGITVLTPKESVLAQLKLIDGLKQSDNGHFYNYTGADMHEIFGKVTTLAFRVLQAYHKRRASNKIANELVPKGPWAGCTHNTA